MLTALVEFTGVFYMTITLTLSVSALKRHRAARGLEKRRAAQRQRRSAKLTGSILLVTAYLTLGVVAFAQTSSNQIGPEGCGA
jgi:hypothetical protein